MFMILSDKFWEIHGHKKLPKIAFPEMSHFKRLKISIEDKTSSDLTPYFKSVAIFIHKGKFIFAWNFSNIERL